MRNGWKWILRLRNVPGPHRPLCLTLARFLVVGATGVAVNSAALFLLYQVAGLPLVVASVFAVELAIVNNFLWNDRWTFGRATLSIRRFLQFNVVSLGGLIIATGTLYGLATTARVYYLAANLIGIAFATAWNFGLNLAWTWRMER